MFVTVSYSLQIRLLIRKYPDLSLKAFFFCLEFNGPANFYNAAQTLGF